MEQKDKHKEEEKGPFFFGIYLNKEWYIKLSIFGVIIVSAIVATWILSFYDENPTNLMNSLFYFFSATAQTLGAIVAIILTGVFALVTFMKSNEHPGYEPSKRLLFKDKSLINAIQYSFLSIFLSLLSLLLTKNLEIKFSFLYYSIFVLLIAVITLSIIGVMFLVDFIFKKSFYYLNPDALIKRIFLNDSLNVSLLNTMCRNSVIDYTILSLFCWSNGNKCLYTRNSMDILHDYFKDKIYFHSYFKLFTDRLLDDITQVRNKSHYDEFFYEDIICRIFDSIHFETVICKPEINICVKNKFCDKIANYKVIIAFIKQYFERITFKYTHNLYFIIFSILDRNINETINNEYSGKIFSLFNNSYYKNLYIDFIELAEYLFSNNYDIYDHKDENDTTLYNKFSLSVFNMLHTAHKYSDELIFDAEFYSLNKKTYYLMLQNLIRVLYYFLIKNDNKIDKIYCSRMIEIIKRNQNEDNHLRSNSLVDTIQVAPTDKARGLQFIVSILLNINMLSYKNGYPDRTIIALRYILDNEIKISLDRKVVKKYLEHLENHNKYDEIKDNYFDFLYGNILNLKYMNRINNEILLKTESDEETLEYVIKYFTKKNPKFSEEYFLFGIKTKEIEDMLSNPMFNYP